MKFATITGGLLGLSTLSQAAINLSHSTNPDGTVNKGDFVRISWEIDETLVRSHISMFVLQKQYWCYATRISCSRLSRRRMTQESGLLVIDPSTPCGVAWDWTRAKAVLFITFLRAKSRRASKSMSLIASLFCRSRIEKCVCWPGGAWNRLYGFYLEGKTIEESPLEFNNLTEWFEMHKWTPPKKEDLKL